MKLKTNILFICLLIAFTSCDTLFMKNNASTDGIDNFESFWHQIDEKYSFFDYKNIDWDSVYAIYKPQVYSNIKEQELFNVLSGVINSLCDGHSNIYAPFDFSRNWSWYLNYPANFDYNIVERTYLGNDYSITGPFRHKLLEDSIAYIYYSSFADNLVTQKQWDYLVYRYRDCKGLIIDVRNNGGGYLENVFFIGSQLINEPHTFGSYKVKNGKDHNAFSENINYTIEPVDKESFEGAFSTKKIIVLTNRHCYSATNFFAMLAASLPNVTLVGDNTGGGGGLPMDYQLPNGWIYRFSTTITYDLLGNNIEGGIAPDIKIDMSAEDIAIGKDSIIEKAIALLK